MQEAAPKDRFDVPVRSLESLGQFSTLESFNRRVRVTGTVSVTVWQGAAHGAPQPPATAPPLMPQQSLCFLPHSREKRPRRGAGAAHGEPQPPDMPEALTVRVTATFSVTVVGTHTW